jgi:hypothetical protein
MFGVIVLLAIMSAAAALVLSEVVAGIESGGRVRSVEMIKSGVDHGVNAAISSLEQQDTALITDGTWDIFAGPVASGTEFLPVLDYPPSGVHAGDYRVRVGLKRGQLTRPPEGEDVRNAYGQVYEVQVSVEAVRVGIAPVEERASFGVLLPYESSHSN